MHSYYESFLDTNDCLWGFYSYNNSCKRHFHRRMELSYILKGEKTVFVNDRSFIARENDVVLIPKYSPHSYADADTCEDILICFPVNTTSEIEEKLKNHILPCVLTDKEYNYSKLLEIFLKLFQLTDTSGDTIYVRSYTAIIFALLTEHYESTNAKDSGNNELIMNMLCYIDEHYSEDLTLKSIAEKLNYNCFYLSKLFNKYVGQNLRTYVNSVRAQHFVNALRNDPKQNVTNLAMKMGFESTTSFYRFFQTNYGISPKKFIIESSLDKKEYKKHARKNIKK